MAKKGGSGRVYVCTDRDIYVLKEDAEMMCNKDISFINSKQRKIFSASIKAVSVFILLTIMICQQEILDRVSQAHNTLFRIYFFRRFRVILFRTHPCCSLVFL